jgi:hypothetical protein
MALRNANQDFLVLLVAEDFSEGDVGFNVGKLHGEIPWWTEARILRRGR